MRSRLLSAMAAMAVVAASAATAWGQDGSIPTGPHQESNESFMGWIMFALVVVPIVLMAVLARRRAKTTPSKLELFDDTNFTTEVLESRMPVLVHFGEEWNVSNRAALSQTELLQYLNRGAVRVGLLEIHDCPETMEHFPGLEPPSYLLFYGGKKLWHRPGLWQADDLQEHIDRALSREGF